MTQICADDVKDTSLLDAQSRGRITTERTENTERGRGKTKVNNPFFCGKISVVFVLSVVNWSSHPFSVLRGGLTAKLRSPLSIRRICDHLRHLRLNFRVFVFGEGKESKAGHSKDPSASLAPHYPFLSGLIRG